ncbi:MAG TPA: hypothetical protein PK867_06735, partial [Pirellulales bacterium]|nr:hypothetical protein [Pirellulales bacterium]
MLAALLLTPLWAASSALAGEAFRAGQHITVANEGAPLMRGWHTLATLSQGQRLKVLKTEGNWIGTSTSVNGRRVSGWVWNRHVATPSQQAKRRTAQRRYSYQPGAMLTPYRHQYSTSPLDGVRAGRRLIMGVTPYFKFRGFREAVSVKLKSAS